MCFLLNCQWYRVFQHKLFFCIMRKTPNRLVTEKSDTHPQLSSYNGEIFIAYWPHLHF